MSISLILFTIIHVFALGFMVESLRRVFKISRELPLKESHSTLPFGFLRLRYVVIIYIIGYLVWILLSLWLYKHFILTPTPVNY